MSNLIQQLINEQIEDSILVKQTLARSPHILDAVKAASELCVAVYRQNCKILIAGNGGSAADAQHMAAELSGRFNFDRPGIPAIALTANSSVVTAVGNDYSYAQVFSRQVQALGQANDLFLGISTSGNSSNVVEAAKQAKLSGLKTIGLTGTAQSKLSEICDVCVQVPSTNTARVQECHILIVHLLCGAVEETLFGESYGLLDRREVPLAKDPELTQQGSVPALLPTH